MNFIQIHAKFDSLKLRIKSWHYSEHLLQKIFYFTVYTIWILTARPIRFIFSSNYRYLIYLKYFKNKDLHQVSNYTGYNRYPDLFSVSKELIKDTEELKILSYGCSTGEEVFSLREYFPNAYLVGVDINKKNIKKAMRLNIDDKIIFSDNIKKALAKHGPFDIIFALAVFQRTENKAKNTLDSSNIYPFEKFNAQLTELNKCVKPNGYFIIDHTDYLFEDADIASNYHAITGEHNIVHKRYLFDKNNQKMSNFVLHHRIFIKD